MMAPIVLLARHTVLYAKVNFTTPWSTLSAEKEMDTQFHTRSLMDTRIAWSYTVLCFSPTIYVCIGHNTASCDRLGL